MSGLGKTRPAKRDLERRNFTVFKVRAFRGFLFVPAGIHEAWNVDSCFHRNEGTGGNEGGNPPCQKQARREFYI